MKTSECVDNEVTNPIGGGTKSIGYGDGISREWVPSTELV